MIEENVDGEESKETALSQQSKVHGSTLPHRRAAAAQHHRDSSAMNDLGVESISGMTETEMTGSTVQVPHTNLIGNYNLRVRGHANADLGGRVTDAGRPTTMSNMLGKARGDSNA